MRLLSSLPCVRGMFSLFAAVLFSFFTLVGNAGAQIKNLADGFEALPKNAKVVIMPTDIELFSISGGGVLEPKADWTEAASRHFKAALIEKKKSLGDTVRVMKEKTGADYALFSWIRDSYASGERVATMIVLALLGVGVPGGSQTGYASLVDLNTGRIVWFNRLVRASGDLREASKAMETLNTLLDTFPGSRP